MPTFGQNNDALAAGLSSLAKGLFPDATKQATILYRRAQMDALGANAEFDRERVAGLRREAGALAEARTRFERGDVAGALAALTLGGREGMQFGGRHAAAIMAAPGQSFTSQDRARMEVGAGVQHYDNTEHGVRTAPTKVNQDQVAVYTPEDAAYRGHPGQTVIGGHRSVRPGEVQVAAPGSGLPTLRGPDTETTARGALINRLAPGLADGSTELTRGIMALIAPSGLAADIRGDAQRYTADRRLDGTIYTADGRLAQQGLANEGRANVAHIGAQSRERTEEMRQTGANQRNERTNDTRREGFTVGGAARRYAADRGVDAAQVRADGAVRAAEARGPAGQRGSSAAPPVVRGKEAGDMRAEAARQIEQTYGASPRPELMDRLLPQITQEFQKTRDVAQAVQNVVSGLPSKDRAKFTGWRNQWLDGFNEDAPAQAPAQTPAPQAQPPRPAASGNAPANPVQNGGGLPPEAAARLREGVQTRFQNGQVWTIQNGQPVRVQ